MSTAWRNSYGSSMNSARSRCTGAGCAHDGVDIAIAAMANQSPGILMPAPYQVGYFIGSLSSKSINRMLANALVQLAPKELVMTEIPFKDLPLYSQDYEANYPPVAQALKDSIAKSDAILFVTPEYNRSIPGGLKNAIDWASRPYGKNSFSRKP